MIWPVWKKMDNNYSFLFSLGVSFLSSLPFRFSKPSFFSNSPDPDLSRRNWNGMQKVVVERE